VSILFLCQFTNMEHRFKNTPRFLLHPKHKLVIIKTLTLRNVTKKPIFLLKIKLNKEIIIKLTKLYIYIVIMKIN
jgi:hypothetical protein